MLISKIRYQSEVNMLDMEAENHKESEKKIDYIVDNLKAVGMKCNKNKGLSKFAETYQLENFKDNLLIIFNHFKVYMSEDRKGTEKDVEALKKTFKKYGFKVWDKTDRSRDEIISILDKLVEMDFTSYGCVAVAVLTHGSTEGKLLTKGPKYYTEKDIIMRLHVKQNPTLENKPKIIIIQSCRGKQQTVAMHVNRPSSTSRENNTDDNFYNLPVDTDMLVIHSAYAGMPSFREDGGTWLVQTLCSEIDSLAYTEDLESILINVKKNVAEKNREKYNYATCVTETLTQMPVITSTLTRKLHLRKYSEHQNIYETSSDSDSCLRESEKNLHAWGGQRIHSNISSSTTTKNMLEKFLEFATIQQNWFNEKEQVELKRDWTDPQINLPTVQHYFEQLMSSLDKRREQFKKVLTLGEELIAQNHPEKNTVEMHVQKMVLQMDRLLQLTLCLQTHIKHTTQYYDFLENVKLAEKMLRKCEEELIRSLCHTEITVQQISYLSKRITEIYNELSECSNAINKLETDTDVIRSIKQRKRPVTRPFKAEIICDYKHANMTITKGATVNVLIEDSESNWRVSLDNDTQTKVVLPSAMIATLSKTQDITNAVSSLRTAYDRVQQLYLIKIRRYKQNVVLLLINWLKRRKFSELIVMGAEKRQLFLQNITNGVNKLRKNCSENDSRMQRLSIEIDEIKKLFDECDRRDQAYRFKHADSLENTLLIFTEQLSYLFECLKNLEKQYEDLARYISRDPDTLEYMIFQYKNWEDRRKELLNNVKEMEDGFKSINTDDSTIKIIFKKIMDKWNEMESNSQNLDKMLTILNTVVKKLEENNQMIYQFERELMLFKDLPNHVGVLFEMSEALNVIKERFGNQQIHADQMHNNFKNSKHLVEIFITTLPKSSSSYSHKYEDLNSISKEILQQENRWTNIRNMLTSGCTSYEKAYQVFLNYSDSQERPKRGLDLLTKYFNESVNPPHSGIRQLNDTFEFMEEQFASAEKLSSEIDQVNEYGRMFIEEAKNHAERCQNYAKWLCQIHSSWNIGHIQLQAEIDMAKRLREKGLKPDIERLTTGADAVANELHELNIKYLQLTNKLDEMLLMFRT